MRNQALSFRAAAIVTALLAGSLSACMSTAAERRGDIREDTRTCDRFGARYGSPAYSDCMLAQQRRRDDKQLRTLEEMRATSDIAREGQIMAERARRDRCRRKPERKECGL